MVDLPCLKMFIKSLKFITILFASCQLVEGVFQRRTRSFNDALLTKIATCKKFVHVESSGILNYLGNVTFISPVNFKGRWHLEMFTKEPFTFLGGWGVIIKEDGPNKHADIFSTKITQLNIGDEITFRFRISYARNKPIPYVSQLKWEGRQICGQIPEFVASNRNTTDTRTDRKHYLPATNNFEDNARRRYGTSSTKSKTPVQLDVGHVIIVSPDSFSLS